MHENIGICTVYTCTDMDSLLILRIQNDRERQVISAGNYTIHPYWEHDQAPSISSITHYKIIYKFTFPNHIHCEYSENKNEITNVNFSKQ